MLNKEAEIKNPLFISFNSNELSEPETNQEKKDKNNNTTLEWEMTKNWTNESISLLLEYSHKYDRSWRKIAKLLKNKTPRQCAYMFDNLSSVSRVKFQRIDDLCILDCVEKFGFNWTLIQNEMPNFTEKQIASRYHKFLYQKHQEVPQNKPIQPISPVSIETNDSHSHSASNDCLNKNNQIMNYANISSSFDKLISRYSFINRKIKNIVKVLISLNSQKSNEYKWNELNVFHTKIIKIKTKFAIKGNLLLKRIKTEGSVKCTEKMNDFLDKQMKLIKLCQINASLYRNISLLMKDVK